jgi:hypothetical protein
MKFETGGLKLFSDFHSPPGEYCSSAKWRKNCCHLVDWVGEFYELPAIYQVKAEHNVCCCSACE